ncbi:hypothetical protein ABPG72_013163 [Tetrahymena utriculariae]
MGQSCEKLQSQQKDIEDMKAAIKQLKELMDQTRGVQDTLKQNLEQITTTTADVVNKYQSVVSKVDTFEQTIKDLEVKMQKTVEQAVKSSASSAMKSLF